MLKNQKLRLRMMLFNEKEDDDFPLPFAHTLISTVGFNSREWHVLPRSTHWRKEHFLLAGTFLDSQFKDRFRMSRKSFSVFMLFYNHISKSSKRIFVLQFLLNIVSLSSCTMSPRGTATRRLRINSVSVKVQSATLLGMFRRLLYSN